MNSPKIGRVRNLPVVIALLSLLQLHAFGAITINIGAGTLATSGGAPMALDGLVILVVSTLDSTFSGPTDLSFVTGDDKVVKKWDLNAGGAGTPGVLSDSTGPISDMTVVSSDWNADDPLAIYWFPTLTLSSGSPGPGTTYNTYRDPAPLSGSPGPLDSSDRWFTPANGTIGLVFATQNFGGSNPDTAGYASLTTVPEPADYATVFGVACLLAALARKNLDLRHKESVRT